jgi:hypothetical protein
VRVAAGQGAKKGKDSASFLKKRSKKLFPVGAQSVGPGERQPGKSFLVLFFKKELLPFASPAYFVTRVGLLSALFRNTCIAELMPAESVAEM